jgi:hypothetical protein
VTQDEDALVPVLGLIDKLGQVRLGVGEGGLNHMTIMTIKVYVCHAIPNA